ncbi:hypothetical protein BGX38DRAFT_1265408 [Terfezia claveryi]|nr:hypothetical protein BGX38DRAFT_1265408 [Terfezia claveryi]
MSEAMMPISADALHYRTLLFELNNPIVISADKFNEIWPYVDSVYTTLQQALLQCNGTVQVQKYECRLRKSSKSATARVAAEGKIIKRRNSSIRDKNLCHVRIKVSRPVDGTAVTIERLDEHIHSHDIEESFRIRKPSILLGYLKSEAAKITLRLKYTMLYGAGTHEGSEQLRKLGGSSLKRQDIVNLKRGMKPDLRMLPHGKLFEDDVLQARNLLIEREWLFAELQIVDSKKEQRWGFIFAHPTRLLILQKRGWFTQFDATHKLNRWGHNMFSFLVRNEHNVWIPTAQFQNHQSLSVIASFLVKGVPV